MAEDDEVDVLGDYSFDLLNKTDSFDGTPLVSQNSDLLNCDYTIHPQWLLDKPSANPALWYTSDLEMSKQIDFDNQSEPHTTQQQNSITDESGWTEKEKDLLNRGIEIFGKSNVNLSQFIGSRTPAEVKYFLKNFYSDVQLSYTSVFDGNCIEETIVSSESNEVLQDNEIPASIEEVIDAVSTAKPTTVIRKRTNSSRKNDEYNCSISYADIPCGQSLLKSSYVNQEQRNDMNRRSVKVKFKTNLKILKHKNTSAPKKPQKQAKKVERKATKTENESNKQSALIELKKDVLIVTGNGIGVPVCEGEEVVKIIKENENENSSSDIEVDVDVEEEELKENKLNSQTHSNVIKAKEVKVTTIIDTEKASVECSKFEELSKALPKKSPQLEELDAAVIKELLSPDYPTNEILIGRQDINEVERFLFFEFFEGRPTKTPKRYLHIRNHILDTWKVLKPNYVRKTTIRNGLKQAGDVNLIGRIHSYLEQIGAINFGCELTNYCRPLLDLAVVSTTPKEKFVPKPVESLSRQRIKKKYINDGEGGYTLTHDESGEIINTIVVNEEPATKQRSYIKKPSIRLIYCRAFTDDYQQKYSISLDVTTLILMDLHAHMYLTEVMGLIGGYWNARTKELLIKRYVPCKNIASSLTHCDMCPISQANAAELLHNENLDILGWYHSHPTFAPEPSQQDLDTQLSVQKWIGNKTPCIGFILSPFSLHGALIASPYRCMIVDKREEEQQFVPYKFKVDLLSDRLDVEDLIEKARRIIGTENKLQPIIKSRVEFMKSYFQDNTITYLDKYIYSVKMHLAKCSNINKMTCDAIIEGLIDVCSQ